MGWLSFNVESTKNRKQIMDDQFNSEHLEVVKSAMVGTVYYAAVKSLKQGKIFGLVCLTSVQNKEWYNFGYKDMDESMGPAYYDCPKSILDLLSPTEYEWAKEWRAQCYKRLEAKKSPTRLNNLPIGARILCNGKVLIKRAAAYQFKTPFWMVEGQNTYFKRNHIIDYQVL